MIEIDPSKPMQTRRQLAIDPEMCMFAPTMSTAKPKNIKEVMADHAWIEAMQEELHQFCLQTQECWEPLVDNHWKGSIKIILSGNRAALRGFERKSILHRQLLEI
ncbi:hypothetical protein Tco_0280836 [Tanacetum coccineum]